MPNHLAVVLSATRHDWQHCRGIEFLLVLQAMEGSNSTGLLLLPGAGQPLGCAGPYVLRLRI